MKYSRIDGNILKNMMVNGLNYLKSQEKNINSINVFPVPDGDTGSNLRLTLENGIKSAGEDAHAGNYAKSLAKGMLYGARGNSGVILSQLFYGMSEKFTNKSILDAAELAEGFSAGVRAAYKAVRNPKEGTILTVTREGISALSGKVGRSTNLEVFFSVYVAEMRKSLENTPNIMPVLKEAGVVDSGALGYIVIVEGMLKFLQNEIVSGEAVDADPDAFTAKKTQPGDYGYCTEFVLSVKDIKNFRKDAFESALDDLGDSLVVALLEDALKVHIHTKKPGDVLNFAQNYGEFISIKIENMELQSETAALPAPPKSDTLAKIVFSEGEGANELFSELGCIVLNTVNPSSEEIVNIISETNCINVVIIPNNKNAILSTEQAEKLLEGFNIHIIETSNIMEGYYVAASDDISSKNYDYRIKSMREALESINVFSVFPAARDCSLNGISAKEGEFVTASGGELLESGENFLTAMTETLDHADLSGCSTMIIMKGGSFTENEDEIISALEKYEGIDVNFLEGGFPVNTALIGLL